MENYKQKYEAALEQAKQELKACGSLNCDAARQIFRLFPELKKSENERIKEELIHFLETCRDPRFVDNRKQDEWITWLEKQNEIDKTSYNIAEKEKYDFVSRQFIECRKSFNEFKEDNSYWLEYVGNDTYVGRSDNILNKKFHITPKQLYRLFTQQHCPKENNANEEINAYGKYVDECLNEAAKHFYSEGEDTYSVADLFYAGVRCGQSQLEKQCEQKPDWSEEDEIGFGDALWAIELARTITKDENDMGNLWYAEKWLKSLKDRILSQQKQSEQKPDDNSKFKVDDWIVNDFSKNIFLIKSYSSGYCTLEDTEGKFYNPCLPPNNAFHLWTINDAKNGDVLVCDDERPFIFKGLLDYNHPDCPVAYCGIDYEDSFIVSSGVNFWTDDNVKPATKEQRDLLFQKMKEAGYKWNATTKTLKMIELMKRPSDESVKNDVYSGLSKLDDALQHTFYGSEMHDHEFHGGADTWSFPDGVREKLKDDKRYRVWYTRHDAADPYDTSSNYHVYYIKEI